MRNKKRVSAAILGVCLLGSVASAGTVMGETITADEGTSNTTVTYTVPSTSFTVTIPPSVTIDPSTNAGTAKITLDATNYKPVYDTGYDAMQIVVSLKNAANRANKVNYLVNANNKIPYTIKKNGTDVILETEGMVGEHAIINWTTRDSNSKTASADLAFAVTGTAAVAGDYTDTLTFKVAATAMEENETPIL